MQREEPGKVAIQSELYAHFGLAAPAEEIKYAYHKSCFRIRSGITIAEQ